MAIMAAEKSGINIKDIFKILNKIKPITGRLEKIGRINNNSKVILDYAHSPDALKIVLKNIRDQFYKKENFNSFWLWWRQRQVQKKIDGKIVKFIL